MVERIGDRQGLKVRDGRGDRVLINFSGMMKKIPARFFTFYELE